MSAESIPQPPELVVTKTPPAPPLPTQSPHSHSPAKEDKYKLELEKLNKQIARYRDIIEQQEKLLQVSHLLLICSYSTSARCSSVLSALF